MAKWPSDKELEEIYRKGSEKHNFEYDPKGWDEMSALLDKKENKKIIFFILFGLLFLFGTSLYFGSTEWRNNLYPIEASFENVSVPLAQEASSDTDITPLKATLQNYSSADKDANHYSESTIESKGTDQTIDSRIIKKNTDLQIQLKSKNPWSGSTKEALSNSISNSNPELVLPTTEDQQHAIIKFETLEKPASIRINFSITSLLPKSNFFEIPTYQYLQFPEIDSLSNYSEKSVQKGANITVVALLGAESSWTATGEFSSIDYSIGLGMNARLGKKIGFSIGASYIRDLYIANRGDYNAHQEFWRQTDEEPNYTSANNKMVEINTGLSYYFNGWQKNGVGIHLDILSNFMLSEQYSYHFEEESMNFSSSWTRSNSTWLNAINISPVYRFSANTRGSFEIGPYLKVPLSGIGHGGIMLSSFGVKANVRIF